MIKFQLRQYVVAPADPPVHVPRGGRPECRRGGRSICVGSDGSLCDTPPDSTRASPPCPSRLGTTGGYHTGSCSPLAPTAPHPDYDAPHTPSLTPASRLVHHRRGLATFFGIDMITGTRVTPTLITLILLRIFLEILGKLIEMLNLSFIYLTPKCTNRW